MREQGVEGIVFVASDDGTMHILFPDKDGVQAELDALHEYLAKLGEMCIAKAEPFAERRARRQAEIAGLKQALAVIDGEAVLLQKSSSRRVLRGSRT